MRRTLRQPLVVNPLRTIVSVTVFPAMLLAALVASGCEKTNDLPRLQDEALATAKDYQQRFDELSHRAAALGQRGNALPPETLNSADARRVFQQALVTIDDHRRDLQKVPAAVKAAVASGNPEALHKIIGEVHEHFEDGVTKASAQLAAFEGWLWMAEQWQNVPRTPAPPADTDTDDPAPGGAPAR